MRVLVLCDDYYHLAPVTRGGLAPLGEEFDFDFVEDVSDWSPASLSEYPVVVLSKSNNTSSKKTDPWMTDEVQEALRAYVAAGDGLLAIHSGTASYREAKVLRATLGGVFIQHPPQALVTMQPKAGHPLTEGSAAYAAQDEHYFMELDVADAYVFLTTVSEHGEQPGGWTRTEGKGRVCVLTPGHNVEVWLHPSFQTLLRNALNWCAGQS